MAVHISNVKWVSTGRRMGIFLPFYTRNIFDYELKNILIIYYNTMLGYLSVKVCVTFFSTLLNSASHYQRKVNPVQSAGRL